ncbi:MAG: glycosyltransferase family 2 protein [Candidatus Peribacteraceae bacterium]|jgi:glycosyltransferase involved in cell wall biosynthesis|nr:glycosyltransferase family 2 protein [Candidatus Peribacteraceae bacterium]
MDFTIIIPAYNEAGGIAKVLSELTQAKPGVPIIVVDDGSSDGTGDAARSVSGITVITHKRNKGYGAALKTAIREAQTEWVATYDSDGQHTPENIDAILKELDKDTDLVIGARQGYKGPWIRQPGKRLIGMVANFVTETKIPDYNSGLRAFRRKKALQYMHLFPNGFSLSTTSTVCFLKEGLNVVWTPIVIKERTGKSTVRPRDAVKTLMLIIRLITLFSPLRIFLPASFLIGLVAIATFVYDLYVNQNVSDGAVMLISLTTLLFFFGLIIDQVAAIRREIGVHSSS